MNYSLQNNIIEDYCQGNTIIAQIYTITFKIKFYWLMLEEFNHDAKERIVVNKHYE